MAAGKYKQWLEPDGLLRIDTFPQTERHPPHERKPKISLFSRKFPKSFESW